ncbi:DUF6801 domain-containing protein [Streptomyces sp. NPDC056161]|uniref:DUF6801 domain-containing protein n=1 Tax=Streptomyces sp. NPDC056161 TaxID=3345732 RepID=UPI0035DCE521
MRGPRAAVRRPSRVRARGAAIAAFVVLAAMVPAVAVAAGPRQADAELPYVCTLPSGQRPVTVRISAVFPDRVAAGEPIRPADVTTTVEFPAEAVADLAAAGAAGVRAETRLTVAVAQNDARAEATWRGTAQPAVLPPTGPLTLTATGDVPTVTGQGDGELTLSAAHLAVDLTPSATDGATGAPAAFTAECSLAEDAPGSGLLATVPVGAAPSGPGGSPTASPSASASASPGGQGGDPADRQGERAPRVSGDTPGGTADRPDAPPCKYDAGYPAGPQSLDAYITGYSNVQKLKGAALIPLTCTLIEQGPPEFIPYPDWSGGTIKQHSTGDLYNGGRKASLPITATFLTFGFTPTTATMVLEQTGPVTIDSLGATDFMFTSTDTWVRVPLVLKVTSLSVNGTPLAVGPNCRTEKPLSSPDPDPANHPGDHLVLHGRGEQVTGEPATGYLLTSGGPLTGEMSIPAFTGCGAGGENIDRLLTASVSGSGNYVKQIQGQTCFVSAETPNPDECTADLQPLKIPVPER